MIAIFSKLHVIIIKTLKMLPNVTHCDLFVVLDSLRVIYILRLSSLVKKTMELNHLLVC